MQEENILGFWLIVLVIWLLPLAINLIRESKKGCLVPVLVLLAPLTLGITWIIAIVCACGKTDAERENEEKRNYELRLQDLASRIKAYNKKVRQALEDDLIRSRALYQNGIISEEECKKRLERLKDEAADDLIQVDIDNKDELAAFLTKEDELAKIAKDKADAEALQAWFAHSMGVALGVAVGNKMSDR